MVPQKLMRVGQEGKPRVAVIPTENTESEVKVIGCERTQNKYKVVGARLGPYSVRAAIIPCRQLCNRVYLCYTRPYMYESHPMIPPSFPPKL